MFSENARNSEPGQALGMAFLFWVAKIEICKNSFIFEKFKVKIQSSFGWMVAGGVKVKLDWDHLQPRLPI